MDSRTDQHLSPYPSFGSKVGSIYIDIDINTFAKLSFCKSKGLSLECEHKKVDQEIGNFVTLNEDNKAWVYYLPQNKKEGFFQVFD